MGRKTRRAPGSFFCLNKIAPVLSRSVGPFCPTCACDLFQRISGASPRRLFSETSTLSGSLMRCYASHLNEVHHQIRDQPAGLWRFSIFDVSRRSGTTADRSWPSRHQPRSPSSGRGDGPPFAGSELGVGPGALSLERRTLCVGTWSIH